MLSVNSKMNKAVTTLDMKFCRFNFVTPLQM